MRFKFRTTALLLVVISLQLSAGRAKAIEILRGRAIQGGLVVLKTKPGASIKINDRIVIVTQQGLAIAGFHRDDTASITVEATHPDGSEYKLVLKPVVRNYQEQRIDGLPKEMVTPPPRVIERILRERKEVIKARSIESQLDAFAGKFSWPVAGTITGVYGSRRILNGEPRAPHYGIDIAAPAGTPIFAPQTGIVRMVADLYFTGWTIILDHGHGLSSTFLHLQSSAVNVGDKVIKGDILGTVGSTGRSTGAHLDWRINLFNKRLDPALVAGAMPSKP